MNTEEMNMDVLTLMLGGYFLASGVMDIVVSFKVPAGEGKGWMLVGGTHWRWTNRGWRPGSRCSI